MRYVYNGYLRSLTAGVFVVCLCILCTLSFGQSYLVHQYSERDGLPSGNVYDIGQDHLGRMWFATRGGIAVYDGISWECFSVSDGLPVLSFSKIFVDRKGRVWAVATPGQGGFHAIYHDGTFGGTWHTIESLNVPFDTTRITSFQIMEQKQGHQGQQGRDKPVFAVGTPQQGIHVWYRGKWKSVREEHGLLSNSINGIASLAGKFYAAADKGISIITLTPDGNPLIENHSSASLGLPPGSEEIISIAVEFKDKYPDCPLNHSRIWLCGRNWLGYLEENRLKMIGSAGSDLFDLSDLISMSKDDMVKLLPDYRSGLYVGSLVSINYFNYRRRTWESLRVSSGLISEGANAMFIDAEKNIWIACDRGVSKLSSRRFANFRMMHGLLEDEVSAVLEYEPGKFVMGHNSGITFYDGKDFRALPIYQPTKSRIPYNRVLDMGLDSGGNLWLAMSRAGVAKIHPHRPLQITWYEIPYSPEGFVSSVFVDKMDRVWIGTSKGLFFLKGNKAVRERVGKFSLFNIRRIFGEDGRLRYIASIYEGVFVYDFREKQWKNYRVPGNENANSIYSVIKTSGGQLLVGTLAGLFILENETLKKFNKNGFQVDRPVFFIMEDARDRLWIGTDDGVIRRDGTSTRRYSINDGLIGTETNRAAAIQDTAGRIWIGTNRGLSIYDEVFDNNELFNPAPAIHLLYMEVPGKDERIPMTANKSKSLRLGSRENSIIFHFRGISFVDERANRFKSKLEGYDREWSEESYPYNQMIRYSRLPSGTYRFHIKVRNARGVWSDAAASPEIVILRPFYEQWWFYLLGFLVMAGIFYTIFQFISQKRHAALLEKEVAERTHRLKAVESQYHTLFEESKDVVFITTPEGKFMDINPAGVELFGYPSKEELLNTPVKYVYSNPRDRERVRESIEKDGYVKDYELEFIKKDGEPITALVTATLVRDKYMDKDGPGKIAAYRGIIRDITDKKRLEQQLIQAQKMEAIGTLAGGIAHDFNNILGVIVGYTELALEDLPESTPVRNNIRQVLVAAERASELVKQILAFSRQSERTRKPLALNPVIKESLKLLRSSLPATIEIRHHIRVDAGDDVVLADPTQIHQVMMNLAANAAHAMRENGGIMEVSLDEVYLDPESALKHKNIQPGSYLRLTVSDTGHGIPGVVMKRIFEPYFTTKNPGEGTGMGLAVIHGIVKSHGGDITVYSDPGKGSTFHVYLPQMKEDLAEHEVRPVEEITGGNECILLVDDEEALIEVGSMMLERLGYEVVGKSRPTEALQIFQEKPDHFDLIITDVTMPYMTGFQLAGKIREIDERIPIILCSGFSTAVAKEQMEELGIACFVMKPIIKSELARIVRRVLDEKKSK
jgi:two-component system cell cycle sensor histidine kinase/response regulator CckA